MTISFELIGRAYLASTRAAASEDALFGVVRFAGQWSRYGGPALAAEADLFVARLQCLLSMFEGKDGHRHYGWPEKAIAWAEALPSTQNDRAFGRRAVAEHIAANRYSAELQASRSLPREEMHAAQNAAAARYADALKSLRAIY